MVGHATRRGVLLVTFALFAAAAGGSDSATTRTADLILRTELPSLAAESAFWYAQDVVPPAAGRQWTVVGFLADAVGVRTPSAWSSRDGLHWTRSTLPPSPSPGRDAAFTAAGSGEVVAAFGTMHVGTGARLIGWTRDSGSWSFGSQVTSQWLPVKQVSIDAMAGDAEGFVAVGNEITADSSRVVILESSDGRSWRSIEQPDFTAPAGMAMVMTGVATNGGRAVAVGGAFWRVSRGGPPLPAVFWRDDGRWAPVPASALGADPTLVNGVAEAGAGFLVVGARKLGERLVATAWRSTDGRTWRVSNRSAFVPAPTGDSTVYAVERLGPGFVAVGEADQVPRAWISTDGSRWLELGLPERLLRFGRPGRLRLASSGGTLLLAASRESGSQLWRFFDGRWREVGTGSAFPARDAAVGVTGVAFGSGLAAAVGNASDRNRHAARVWFSDATGWKTARIPSADLATLTSVVDAPPGFVAGGLVERGRRFGPALWHSRDGSSWARAHVPGSPRGTDGAVQAVIREPGRIIAIVNEIVPYPFLKRIVVLTSPDGRSWRRADAVANGMLAARGACSADGILLVVGLTRAGKVDRGTVWERFGRAWRRVLLDRGSEADGCAVRAGSAVVIGKASGHAAVWLRDRAQRWRRAPVAGDLSFTAPARVINAVAATDGGFVAVGGEGGRGEYDLGIWKSADGASWQLVRNGDAAYRERGHQIASSLALDGRGGILVGGSSVGSGALWQGVAP